MEQQNIGDIGAVHTAGARWARRRDRCGSIYTHWGMGKAAATVVKGAFGILERIFAPQHTGFRFSAISVPAPPPILTLNIKY